MSRPEKCTMRSAIPRCLITSVLALLLLGGEAARSQDLEPSDDFNKGARSSLQFLKIGLGARQAALGEASIAMVRDVNAVYWNPANISGVESFEVGFNYVRWLADLNYVAGTVGYRLGTLGILSAHVAALDYGNIEEALVTSTGGGNDTRTGDTFSGSDLMAGVTLAREFTDRLSIGVTAKFIREELFTFSSSTFAFDAGTNYDLGYKGLRLAMSVQNFGGAVEFLEDGSSTEGFDLPIIFRIGLSMSVMSPDGNSLVTIGNGHVMRVGVEAINTNDFSERFHVGGEYLLYDLIALRAGYRLNYAEGNLALGFGVSPSVSGTEVRLDYAYVDYEFLDAPHRFTMTLAF